jgi:hypothetical protein
MRRSIAILGLLLLVAFGLTREARVTIDLAAPSDRDPRRIEAAATVAGTALGLIVTWTVDRMERGR